MSFSTEDRADGGVERQVDDGVSAPYVEIENQCPVCDETIYYKKADRKFESVTIPTNPNPDTLKTGRINEETYELECDDCGTKWFIINTEMTTTTIAKKGTKK